MDIVHACRAERSAEQNRKTAEAEWRRAWWTTTLALGDLPPQGVMGEMEQARQILGLKSADSLQRRRQLGQLVDRDGLKADVIHSLPPRKAVSVARSGQTIDRAMAERLLASDEEQQSLRDFAEQSTGEEFERITPEQIKREPVERVAAAFTEAIKESPQLADAAQTALVGTGRPPAPAAVAKALEDPAYARSVVRRNPHGEGMRNVEREVAATAGVETGPTQRERQADLMGWSANFDSALSRITAALADAETAWRHMTPEQRRLRRFQVTVAEHSRRLATFVEADVPDDLSELDAT